MTGVGIDDQWLARLNSGFRLLDLSPPADVSKQLLRFIRLLNKWNRAYNLTAIRDPLEMVDRHLIDSLTVFPYVTGERILDVGTGAGLPGIPLALLLPNSHFVLLDANSKKIRFVRQAVLELGLQNVEPVHARVEDYRPKQPFDTLISRAFASLPRMMRLTESLRGAHSRLLAMKGTLPREEIEQIEKDYRVKTVNLPAPPALGERHLILISRAPQALA
jgi:16S rRNA (guanine527-N7)-methyltransferase